MQKAFAARDVTLLIGCSNYDPSQAEAQVRAMLARGVEVLAIIGEAQRPGLFELIQARRVPYLVTYGARPDTPHPCIGFDNREAYRRITRHLLDLGHRVVGVILQPVKGNDRVASRLAGVCEELAEHGLGLRPHHRFESAYSFASGRAGLRALLTGPGPRPTAVICGNDVLAIGALMEARAMGMRVPRDLSITGFDDTALAAETDPALTTMKVDSAEIGRMAALHLLASMEGATPPGKTILTPVLVERGTTAI